MIAVEIVAYLLFGAVAIAFAVCIVYVIPFGIGYIAIRSDDPALNWLVGWLSIIASVTLTIVGKLVANELLHWPPKGG